MASSIRGLFYHPWVRSSVGSIIRGFHRGSTSSWDTLDSDNPISEKTQGNSRHALMTPWDPCNLASRLSIGPRARAETRTLVLSNCDNCCERPDKGHQTPETTMHDHRHKTRPAKSWQGQKHQTRSDTVTSTRFRCNQPQSQAPNTTKQGHTHTHTPSRTTQVHKHQARPNTVHKYRHCHNHLTI